MSELNQAYWTERYEAGNTGWNIGYPSTPLKDYIDQLPSKDLRILVPGAGNAYEAGYLWEQGFSNVHVLDISKHPLDAFAMKFPTFPKSQIHHEDFFNHEGVYDVILEQTFFCALDPKHRESYAKKMPELLGKEGTLAGVMFDFPLTEKGPPFGGSIENYKALFEPFFKIQTMERCRNSIPPRAGKELFIQLVKKP